MTLPELVGAQLIVGFSGSACTDELIAHLQAIHAGGLVAFERNFVSPDQFHSLIQEIQERLGHRLVVMVDHEGGRIIRFRTGLTQFPDARTVGKTQQPEEVYHQGQREAEELCVLGVHVNLAPCVDVLVEGSDPVIGDRSYGSDPQCVAAFGVSRIRGLQERGVAACAKHFPGLGAVPKDPHHHLPTVDLDWKAIRSIHLGPFVAAIQADVAAIMSSHVCYPNLVEGPPRPATFSSRLIAQLLRQELRFHGAVLTDDLEMGALRALCSFAEAAVQAVEAGHDGLLICSDPALQREAHTVLMAAYQAGRLPVEGLMRSVRRLAALRRNNPGNS